MIFNTLTNEIDTLCFDLSHEKLDRRVEIFADQLAEIKNFISGCCEYAESQSLIITGRAGSGKSHVLLNRALFELRDEFRRAKIDRTHNATDRATDMFIQIELDGEIHTSNSLTIKSIAQQLLNKSQRDALLFTDQWQMMQSNDAANIENDSYCINNENKMDQSDSDQSEYSIDSKDEQNSQESESENEVNAVDENENLRDSHNTANFSFAKCFRLVLDAMRDGDKNRKLIVFVLDKMEAFAKFSSHQQVLYALYEAIQSNDYAQPICVIGLSRMPNICSDFEKRIKSRFSGRQIHLNVTPICKDFSDYLRICEKLLILRENANDGHDEKNEKEIKKEAEQTNSTTSVERTVSAAWNAEIRRFLLDDVEAERALKNLYHFDNRIGTLVNFLVYGFLCRTLTALKSLRCSSSNSASFNLSEFRLCGAECLRGGISPAFDIDLGVRRIQQMSTAKWFVAISLMRCARMHRETSSSTTSTVSSFISSGSAVPPPNFEIVYKKCVDFNYYASVASSDGSVMSAHHEKSHLNSRKLTRSSALSAIKQLIEEGVVGVSESSREMFVYRKLYLKCSEREMLKCLQQRECDADSSEWLLTFWNS